MDKGFFSFFFSVAPEEGLSLKKKYRAFCLNLGIVFIYPCMLTLVHRFAARKDQSAVISIYELVYLCIKLFILI